MTVAYNGKKIIPAPFVDITKEYIRSNDGHLIGANFALSLRGRLVPLKGSPDSSGVFWDQSGYPTDETTGDKHASLLVKIAALKDLFAAEGKSLEFQAQDGSTPMRCYPKMRSMNFPEGLWVDYAEYNISLEAAEIFSAYSQEDYLPHNDFFYGPVGSGRLFLSNVGENWSIEEGESYDLDNPRSYRISHEVNAVGKEVYDGDGVLSPGWRQAREWVLAHIGADVNFMYMTSGVNIPLYFNTYNYTKNERADEYDGSYAVTETWTLNSGNVIEEFSVSENSRVNEAVKSVSVEGRITGLESRTGNSVTTTKYNAASTKFDQIYAGYPTNMIYTRATTYSNQSGLHPTPTTMTIGKNPIGGTISYNCEYNTRPTNYIAGALYESLNISYNNEADIYGSIPVLGRLAGPVLQNMGTVSEKRVTMNMEVTMPVYSGAAPITVAGFTEMFNSCPRGQISPIFSGFVNYLAANYTDYYRTDDSEQWNPLTGQFSRTCSYTYQ